MLDESGRPREPIRNEVDEDEPYWARVRVAILGISLGLSLLIASKLGWFLQIAGVMICLLSVCVAVYAWVMDVFPMIVRVIKEWWMTDVYGADEPR